jgi:hypothetical protein
MILRKRLPRSWCGPQPQQGQCSAPPHCPGAAEPGHPPPTPLPPPCPPVRPPLPRIGRCAGLEWLPRWMPPGLRDRVLAKELGVAALLPQMKANAAVLAAAWRDRGGGGGGKEAKKGR